MTYYIQLHKFVFHKIIISHIVLSADTPFKLNYQNFQNIKATK